ncbi:MAG: hypothetical protein ACR2RV_23270 [Verrucomicrobiales bacterium]
MKPILNQNLFSASTLGAALMAAAYLAAPLSSEAALVVTANLGSVGVGSSINITGDTSTGANNANTYHSAGLNPYANWGNELVYQFTLTEAATISLTTNSRTGDPDFILLDGLRTATNSKGKQDATDGLGFLFLDGEPPESGTFGEVGAGTYYLSVDTFVGLDGSITPSDSIFDIDMSFEAPPAESLGFTDLGIIGDESDPVVLNTFGSDFDTELGLYDSVGNLLSSNDNSGGFAQSEIGPELLGEGEYFVALGGFDTDFGDMFEVTPGSKTGDFRMNYSAGISGTESGVIDSSNPISWFRFEIGSSSRVPDTGATALFCLLAFGGLRLIKRFAR